MTDEEFAEELHRRYEKHREEIGDVPPMRIVWYPDDLPVFVEGAAIPQPGSLDCFMYEIERRRPR